jgi:HIV Tat-specific factor 1
MFTLDELDEDPALLLDLKEEVREQCEVMGEVLKVMLYDVSVVIISSLPFSAPKVSRDRIHTTQNDY